jgi:hypothetical protein
MRMPTLRHCRGCDAFGKTFAELMVVNVDVVRKMQYPLSTWLGEVLNCLHAPVSASAVVTAEMLAATQYCCGRLLRAVRRAFSEVLVGLHYDSEMGRSSFKSSRRNQRTTC